MILQIDHIALCQKNPEKIAEAMELLGYKPVFSKKGIENPGIKQSLMHRFSEKHDAMLLTSEGNYGIELVSYQHINRKKTNIMPIFENVPKELVSKISELKIGEEVFTEAGIEGLDTHVCCRDNQEENSFRFNKAIIKTSDIRKSAAFWESLGFKPVKSESDFALLEFSSLMPKCSYYIYLQKSSNIYKTFLDEQGFNCIAFVSNSARHEKEILSKKGFDTTDIEELALDRKVFNIFFATGHCGELIEVIGIKGKNEF